MTAFVRNRNFPFPIEDIDKITSSCPIYNECKPRFWKPEPVYSIKATQPFERINIDSIDFKGPLPSVTNNKYILTVVYNFSRFPFAFHAPMLKPKLL